MKNLLIFLTMFMLASCTKQEELPTTCVVDIEYTYDIYTTEELGGNTGFIFIPENVTWTDMYHEGIGYIIVVTDIQETCYFVSESEAQEIIFNQNKYNNEYEKKNNKTIENWAYLRYKHIVKPDPECKCR
jgi:hypothetical protein